jgi:hypothetical protein
MAIQTEMSGKEIDRVLKAIHDAENAENNGLILYIRRGEIAFDTEENLFTVEKLS